MDQGCNYACHTLNLAVLPLYIRIGMHGGTPMLEKTYSNETSSYEGMTHKRLKKKFPHYQNCISFVLISILWMVGW